MVCITLRRQIFCGDRGLPIADFGGVLCCSEFNAFHRHSDGELAVMQIGCPTVGFKVGYSFSIMRLLPAI
jgi:hypothetical protein